MSKRRPIESRTQIQSERDLVKIEEALRLLGQARTLLREAKAPRAHQAVCHAMKSTEGARRHCLCVTSRIVPPSVARVAPMDPENPMHSLGYHWELIDERGHGVGGAQTREEAEQLLARHQARKQVAS